ncbi:MAG: hypothetical protein NC548_20105 [Lachnospiraceae bacterium]|nr:hypothetical protein [Lachnospiraceae bacterium]
MTEINKDKTPRMILHLNSIKDMTQSGKEIYCRKVNSLKVPTYQDCMSCPYFHGMGSGTMIECEWEDEPPLMGDIRRVNWDDRKHELLRVSKLIDDKVIKK